MPRDDTLRWFDANTGEEVNRVVADALRGATQVDDSPDERWIAVVGRDNDVGVVDMSNGQLHGAPTKGHTYPVTTVDFSPDGLTLATGSEDNTIRLWDWEKGQQIGDPMTGHEEWIDQIAFNEDDRRLYSSSCDSIWIWDTTTRQPVGKPIDRGYDFKAMTISPDGRRIVAASHKDIQQWDAESGEASVPRWEATTTRSTISHTAPTAHISCRPRETTRCDSGMPRAETRLANLPSQHRSARHHLWISPQRTSRFVVAQRVSLDGNPPFVGGGIWHFPRPPRGGTSVRQTHLESERRGVEELDLT